MAATSAPALPATVMPDLANFGLGVSEFLEVFHAEARAVLKKTKGDHLAIIRHVLGELHERGLISTTDRTALDASYAAALQALKAKGRAVKALSASQKRLTALVVDPNSTSVGQSLAEMCHSTIKNAALEDALTANGSTGTGTTVIAMTQQIGTVHGTGANALLWGAIGAYIGGSIGGLGGALIGGAIGAAVGACGGDTTVTVTGPGGAGGGGGGAGGPA